MTAPHYNADLLPGMIADFAVDTSELSSYEPEKYRNAFQKPTGNRAQTSGVYHWLNDHMTGPFVFRGGSTAEWREHIQVSNDYDLNLVSTLKDAELVQHSHNPDRAYNKVYREQRSLTATEFRFDTYMNRICFGKQCSQEALIAYVREHGVPVNHVQDLIMQDYLHEERDRFILLRNELLHLLHDGLPYIVGFYVSKEEVDHWLSTNVRGEFKVCQPDRTGWGFGMGLDRDAPPPAFVKFADKAEAAKFRMFFA